MHSFQIFFLLKALFSDIRKSFEVKEEGGQDKLLELALD